MNLCTSLPVDGHACYCVAAMPVLFNPPSVGTSSDGRFLLIQWPAWLNNVTGNGTGPVVSYTLQGLPRLSDANVIWLNLIIRQQQPSRAMIAHTSTNVRQFTYLGVGQCGSMRFDAV